MEKKAKKTRVLHCVASWLNTTENWCYRLISQVPNVETHILTRNFIPGSIWNTAFKIHFWPLNKACNPNSQFIIRVFNYLISKMGMIEQIILAKSLSGTIDIVHAHFANSGWEYLGLAKRLKVPLVISFYGYDYESICFNNPIWIKRYKILFNEASLFLCEGEHGKLKLTELGCPEHKIRIVRLGVEIESISFPESHVKQNKFHIIQLARLMEKKGHCDAIRAVAHASKTIDLEFRIVGSDGDVSRENLKQLAESLEIGHLVHFDERIDFSHIYSYLSRFDLFLHPSKYASNRDCEGGAPVVLLDAQAVGLPVVSTYHCDIPSEVLHEMTGLLYDEGDVNGLADGIVKIAQMSEPEYNAMRMAGRTHVEQQFSIKNNALFLAGFYTEILKSEDV